MPTIERPTEHTLEALLKNAALMFDIAETQRTMAVKVARANGWTYERIGEYINRTHPVARTLALSQEAEEAA
jgi:uncharacterized alpha-E superfamily protein